MSATNKMAYNTQEILGFRSEMRGAPERPLMVKKDDSMALQVNIEKLKELVMLLNDEIIGYRRQFKKMRRNDDVKGALDSMNRRCSNIEKEMLTIEEMVKRIDSHARDRFKTQQKGSEIISQLQERISFLAKEVSAVKEQKKVITNNIIDSIRSDEPKNLQPKKGLQQLISHDEKVTKEISGLKGYTMKNIQRVPKFRELNREVGSMEKEHNKELIAIHSMLGKEHPDVIQEQIRASAAKTSARISGIREKAVEASISREKLGKLHRVLDNRRIRLARQGERPKSVVDITIGKLKENAQVKAEFDELKKEIKESHPEAREEYGQEGSVYLNLKKLGSKIQDIKACLDGGNMLDAKRKYKEAVDFYAKLRQRDDIDVENAYEMLVGLYRRMAK